MCGCGEIFHAMIKVIENRQYTNSNGDVIVQDDEGKVVGKRGKVRGNLESNMTKRAKKWMKMVFYDNDIDTKTFFEKAAKLMAMRMPFNVPIVS